MIYCSYHEFSVKEELLEAKLPSIEGSVVAEHANVRHFRAHMDDVMPTDRQTNKQTDKQTQNLTNRDLVGYT